MKKVFLILVLMTLLFAVCACQAQECQHDVTQWSVATQPTCSQVGQKHLTCQQCNAVVSTAQIDLLNHEYQMTVVAPTKGEQGYNLYQCVNCDYSYKDNYVNLQDICQHENYQWVVVEESTCKQEGLEQYECTSCYLVFEQRSIPVTEHVGTTWVTSAQPSCETNGEQSLLCDNCQEVVQTRAIDSLGHDYQKTVQMPTFEDVGYTKHSCSRCDNFWIDNKIENLVNFHYQVVDGKNVLTVTSEQQVHFNLLQILITESFSTTGNVVENHLVDELVLGKNIISASNMGVLSALKKVTFGEQIQQLGEQCLYDCRKLTEIHFLGDEPAIYRNSLVVNSDMAGMLSIYVSDSAKGFDDLLFGGHRVENNVPAKSGDTSIALQEYAQKANVESTNLIQQLMRLSQQRNQDWLMLIPFEDLSYYKQIKDFTLNLTKDCSTEREKISAVYNYLISNIAYDDNATENSSFEVLTTQKAVCFGYVMLMHDMLCALDITSFYVGGITLSSFDVTTEYMLQNWMDLQPGHAWLGVCMQDGDVLYFDPTWGVSIDDCDFMTEQRVSQYALAQHVNGLSVIPQDYSFSMYKPFLKFLNDDGFIYGANDGVTNNLAPNIVVNRVLQFGTPRVSYDGSSNVSGFEQPLGTFWNTGVVLSSPNADRYFGGNFYRVDGMSYTVEKVCKYISIQNQHYGKNYDLGVDNFVLQNDFLFYKTGNYLILTSYLGEQKNVTVPGWVDGLQVKVIGQNSFKRNVFVENIVFEEGVEIIEGGVFYHNENLKTVTLPASVHTICKEDNRYSNSTILFDKCENLQQIIVDEQNSHFASYNGSLYSKDLSVLYEGANKSSLTFEFSDNIAEIKEYALSFSCFEEIIIPANVKIGKGAFYNCFRLRSVTILDGITEVGSQAFAYCQNLQQVRLPETLTKISSYMFDGAYSLFTIDIPQTVTTVGYSAFFNSGLVSLTLPQNVTQIEDCAFWGCNQLLEIINLSQLPLQKGSQDYAEIALNAMYIFDDANQSKLVIQNDFVFYEDYVLAYFGESTVLQLPDGYRLLDNTFGCNDVVTWQTSGAEFYLWYIDNYHCYHQITHVVFSDDVTVIGENSFYSFINLEEITVTANLTQIKDNVFENSKLAVVNFVGTQEQFDNHPLKDYYSQYKVNIVSA